MFFILPVINVAMRTIPVHLMNALVVFGDSKSVADAADKLGITQPALSKQLKALEELTEQTLFAFSGRNKVLTPVGRDLHGALAARLDGLDQIVSQTINSHAKPDRARLRIVGRRGVLDRISQGIEFPGFIEFVEGSNEQVLEELRARNSDIGVTYARPDTHELVSRPLFREKFSLVVPKRQKVIQRQFGKKLLMDLLDQPCVGFKPNDEVLARLCRAHTIDSSQLKMIRAMADYASLARMVEAGLGWSVLPSYLSLDPKETWRAPIPSDTLSLREFHLLYRKELSSVPWFKSLIQSIMQTLRT